MSASVVLVEVARSGQLHPMLHHSWFDQEKLSARLLESHVVTQMDLKLDKLTHGSLIVWVTFQGEEIRSSCLIVLPIDIKDW